MVPALWDFLRENSQALNHLGVIAIGAIGLPLLWIRTRAADRQARAANAQARIANLQAKTAEQGHITDRFTKAIEQLGSEEVAVRVGGIYALERISKDSPEDHWTIMEVLMAYLRENSTTAWARAIEDGEAVTTALSKLSVATNDLSTQFFMTAIMGKNGPLKLRPETDIQAILTVLGRRSSGARQREVAAGRRLDLAVLDLCGAFLNNAHLEYACLKGADLRLASLRDAYLDRAELHQAVLLGAQFLTQEQLDSASGDESTILPEGLSPAGVPYTRPAHWLKPEPEPSPATSAPCPPPPPEAPPGGPGSR